MEHLEATVGHRRHGSIRNAFSYRADYVLLDPERPQASPLLFSRRGRGLVTLRDRDFGSPQEPGRGAAWCRRLLAARGLGEATNGRLLLVAQPRILGHRFDPVCFWLAHDQAGLLRAVVADVTNTFGDRHAYVVHRKDYAPIGPGDRIAVGKAMHVSPFQPVRGVYRFAFAVRPDFFAARIEFDGAEGRLVAALRGRRRRLTNRAILGACLRRPFGSRRVLALIHWQALKLWAKGARYRDRPTAKGRGAA